MGTQNFRKNIWQDQMVPLLIDSTIYFKYFTNFSRMNQNYCCLPKYSYCTGSYSCKTIHEQMMLFQ